MIVRIIVTIIIITTKVIMSSNSNNTPQQQPPAAAASSGRQKTRQETRINKPQQKPGQPLPTSRNWGPLIVQLLEL